MSLFRTTWREKERVMEALDRVFHLSGFREGQEEIIRDITSGHDTLAVMPTGAGKSLCYQLPAVVTPGLTLVISPLIALMKDQVDALKAKGVRAESLNSGITRDEQLAILDDVANGSVKILFVAPERLQMASFQSFLSRLHIGLIAVDEAHCISQWGHDFRPAYRRIGELRTALDEPPTIALTATASQSVQDDIVEQLHLKDAKRHILGFDRKNLLYSAKIFRTESQKIDFILDFIRENIQQRCFETPAFEGCGIVYASTIRQAEALYNTLNQYGIRTGIYHASLPADERSRIQDAFKDDAYHCLVATNAFGMGVDKPNIRYVIHMSLSSSVEAYTQEAGRAGRDRQPARCILLYAPQDMKIQENFITNNAPDIIIYKAILDAFAVKSKTRKPVPGTRITTADITENFSKKSTRKLNQNALEVAIRKIRSLDLIDITQSGEIVWLADCPKNLATKLNDETQLQAECARQRLKDLMSYVYEEGCRTKFILRYFGSRDYKLFKRCQHCDLCNAMFPTGDAGYDGPFPPEPTHFVILKIISTVARFNRNAVPITLAMTASLLHGSLQDVPEFVTTHAALAYMSDIEIRILIGLLLEADMLQGDEASHLHLTPKGTRFMRSDHPRLDGCAPVLAAYLARRFPDADHTAAAWMPKN